MEIYFENILVDSNNLEYYICTSSDLEEFFTQVSSSIQGCKQGLLTHAPFLVLPQCTAAQSSQL